MSEGRSKRSALLMLTPLVPLVGLLPGGRWLWPLLAPLTLWSFFSERVAASRYRGAVGFALLWALLLSVGVIVLTQMRPAAAAAAIPRGESYRSEMFAWIATGEGEESNPAEFIPTHLIHLGAFSALSWLSAGYLGLALGAWLVGYMSYFVGSFALASQMPLLGSLAAWVPWSVVRVIAFVGIGTLLARPLLVGRPFPFGRREITWLGAGCAGIVLDIAIKTAAAPAYGLFLRSLLRGVAE